MVTKKRGVGSEKVNSPAFLAEGLLAHVKASSQYIGRASIRWDPKYKQKAISLARKNGMMDYSEGCPPCEVKMLNFIRDLAGYEPIHKEDLSLRKRRLAVCNECKHLNGIRCGKCGCFVHIKASFKVFKCPVNKWPNE